MNWERVIVSLIALLLGSMTLFIHYFWVYRIFGWSGMSSRDRLAFLVFIIIFFSVVVTILYKAEVLWFIAP